MKSGWRNGDPVGSDKPRGKSAYRRKSGRDPGLTPTEVHQKNILMRQFMVNPEGPGGNNSAYANSEVWCRKCSGRRMNALGLDSCVGCAK